MDKDIIIHEVGLRDGLQIENTTVETAQKIDWVKHIVGAKIPIVQLGSFVHPKKVPQMADTDQLFSHHLKNQNKPDGVIFSGLVLNQKGLERGLNCNVDMFCMGVSASETHSQNNTGMSIKQALKTNILMAKEALKNGKKVQVSVQSAFGCGYEGKIKKESVLNIVKDFLNAGLNTISIADTAGFAHPQYVQQLFGEIFKLDKNIECACHFHDISGLGLANCYAAYLAGVKFFESAFGGLGGCPFTAVKSGNVCTEDMVFMFKKMGLCAQIDMPRLIDLTGDVSRFFGRELPGKIYKTGLSAINH